MNITFFRTYCRRQKFRRRNRTLLRPLQHADMPPSQLKQLKASLRDSGVLGPQQSKKQKRQNVKSGAAAQNRVQRNAALQSIRDRFNPFEIKAGGTRTKFDVTTRDGNSGTAASRARPGVTKSLGEEKVSFIAALCFTVFTHGSTMYRDAKRYYERWRRGTRSVVY